MMDGKRKVEKLTEKFESGRANEGTGENNSTPPPRSPPKKREESKEKKPTFYTTHDGIKITWDAKKNSTNYKLKIKRKRIEELIEPNTTAPTFLLKQSTYAWITGEVLNISIIAEFDGGEITSICENEEYVVGGKRVPSEVELKYAEKDSYDSLYLTWQKPEANPQKFSVTVCEVGGKDSIEAKYTFETEKVTNILRDLDPLTKYQCAVVAKYSQGEDSTAVMSNILATQELPEEKLKVEDVQIINDSLNPSRQIKVKFKSTSIIASLVKKRQMPHFEVYLTDEHNKKTETQKIDGTVNGRYECCFKYLKSSTTYGASITTIGKNSKKTSVLSNKIKTSEAQRMENFDIKVAGCPIIKTCEAKPKKLISKIEWDLAKLGIEEYNYKLLGVEVSVVPESEKDWGKKEVLEITDKGKCKPTQLQPGITYKVTVQSSYLDLDKGIQVEATASKKLITDIDSPEIKKITCANTQITATWAKAKGAETHVLKIHDEKNKELFNSGPQPSEETTIPMAGHYSYGHTCTFVLEATAKNGKMTKASKTLLIGGDSVVTHVTGIAEGREFKVSWKHPKQTPRGYKLFLFELSGLNLSQASLCDEVSALERTVELYSFTDLKSSTSYCCKVCPLYRNLGCGTQSNTVKTMQRVKTGYERNENFGKTTITHKPTELDNGSVSVTLTWRKVEVGLNHKLIGYRAVLKQIKGYGLYSTTVLDKPLGPEEKQITHMDIAKGYKFNFELHAVYKDLDTGAEDEKTSNHNFLINYGETIVDCTWKEGVITFKWKPVGGATKYVLIIKDEYQKKNLVPDKILFVNKEGEGCEVNMQMSNQLGIGRSCMTKVKAYIEETITSTSEWKAHFIGGTKVARNVQASNNNDNPCRAINISFDFPKHGNASVYKIVAIPLSGRKKTILTQSNPASFEYLRKGVKYKFEVWAKWSDEYLGPSISNFVCTEGAGVKPMVEIRAQNQTTIDLRGAHFKEENKDITILQGDDFGCVRDLAYTYKEEIDGDLVTLNWLEPTFGNKRSDYKIEKFKIEIHKPSTSDKTEHYIEFDKTKRQNSTKGYKLDLGELYNVHVYTIYEDIDQDVLYVSNAEKLSTYTRPCQPRIHRHRHEDDSLKIEWSKVKGAKIYEVDLFIDDSAHPLTAEEKGTSYTKTFDETFGYGTSYYAVVRACGEGGKYNETRTQTNIIGGDRVPTNVEATSEHERVKDPNFQVFLKWKAPRRSPKEYQIEVISEKSQKDIEGIVGETYLVSELRAGTDYYFKVKAKHDDGKISGGCCSNKIQTNPTPTQVKRVWFQPGDNPSTSQRVFWEKVEAERENETTEYRICLKSHDKRKKATSKQKVIVQGDQVIFNNLHPGASYSVTVAGGNSIGFGRESEKVTFTTEWGTPKNVILSNNKAIPSTSMIVKFDVAEGDVLHYVGTLYKYQNNTEEQIRNERVMSPHPFKDLDPNTDYIVKVHAVMDEGTGKDVSSNKATTAPSKTNITDYECCKDGEELSSKEILAKWESDPGCDEHEVIIRCGTTEKAEYRDIIRSENTIKYLCKHEANQYSIQVRSRNCSGLFGEGSDRVIIQLAPAKLEHVAAVLNEESYSIKVSCQKPLYHSAFFLMNAYCGGQLVSNTPEKKENLDTSNRIEWTFTPTEFAEKYFFDLWAEDSMEKRGKITRTSSVTSRPPKLELNRICRQKKFPTTDIKIFWEKQSRCDTYEVQIKIQGQEKNESLGRYKESSCVYRCRSPGNKYVVSARAICGSVAGFWSDEKTITLAPGEIEWTENTDPSNEPVESISIKWKSPGVQPDGYLVRLYDKNKQLGEDIFTDKTEHKFTESLESGSLRYCTVAAYNKIDGGRIDGTPVKSRDYKIEWTVPPYFYVNPDDNVPTRKAQIQWKCPKGVNHFKLEIQNDKTGDVITQDIRGVKENDEKIYTFSYGIPGNPYSVKLFSGCNGRYNEDFLTHKIIFKPHPPSDISVVANKEAKGLSIEYRDAPSSVKSYKITIKPLSKAEKKVTKTTNRQRWVCRNLTPGEQYEVSVVTVIEGVESNALTTDDYIYTFPDEVKNLRSCFEKGNIKFEWDPLNIKPDKYIVQWRVNNEPITEEYTEGTSFSICCLKPATWYRLRVMACSKGNCGSVSEWKAYITRPSPPHSVQVKKDERSPQTCLVVRFEDKEDMQKSYKVTAWYNDKAAREVITKNHFAFLKDLTPGNPYIITVETLFCGEKSDIATVMRI